MVSARRVFAVLVTLVVSIAWCAAAEAASVQKSGYITMADGAKLRYTVVLPAESGRFPVAMKYDGYCEGPTRSPATRASRARQALCSRRATR